MNKKLIFLIIIISLLACERNESDFIADLGDGFSIVVDDRVVLDHNDFEYYDYSTHLIYLKDHTSFVGDIEGFGIFKVYGDKNEIYIGQTVPSNNTIISHGPIIRGGNSGYSNYILPIEFISVADSFGNFKPDVRKDEKVIKALKRYDQFRAGLTCEIKSIQYLSSNNVKVELILKNNDPISYYYLNPDKMGINLFHYFTNGLQIKNVTSYKTFTHNLESTNPEPWNTWSKEWLSLIKGNESKSITINYDNFQQVPADNYKATFQFPGLKNQVERDNLVQNDGQIWLGSINMTKDIIIE